MDTFGRQTDYTFDTVTRKSYNRCNQTTFQASDQVPGAGMQSISSSCRHCEDRLPHTWQEHDEQVLSAPYQEALSKLQDLSEKRAGNFEAYRERTSALNYRTIEVYDKFSKLDREVQDAVTKRLIENDDDRIDVIYEGELTKDLVEEAEKDFSKRLEDIEAKTKPLQRICNEFQLRDVGLYDIYFHDKYLTITLATIIVRTYSGSKKRPSETLNFPLVSAKEARLDNSRTLGLSLLGGYLGLQILAGLATAMSLSFISSTAACLSVPLFLVGLGYVLFNLRPGIVIKYDKESEKIRYPLPKEQRQRVVDLLNQMATIRLGAPPAPTL